MLEHHVSWTELNAMDIDDVDRMCIVADALFDALNGPAPTTPTRTKKGKAQGR